MAERDVQIKIKISGEEASRDLSDLAKQAEVLVERIKALQELGGRRTASQEFALGFIESLGLVGKSADEVADRIDLLNKGFEDLSPDKATELNNELSAAFQELGVEVESVSSTEQEAIKVQEELNTSQEKGVTVTSELKSGFNELLGAVTTLTAGAVSLTAFWNTAISGAAQLELSLTRLGIVASDTGQSQEELADQVREFSDRFGEDLTSSAENLGQVYASGAKDATDATIAFAAAQKLADITGQSTASSLQLILPVLNAYNLGFDKAETVTGGLLVTAQKARIPFQQLAFGLQSTIPIAEQAGVSLEELEASIITLVQEAGVPPRRAFRELQQLLINIQQPGGDVALIFRNAGFETAQAAIEARGFGGALKIITDVAQKGGATVSGLTNNARAMAAALALAGNSGDGLNKALDTLTKSQGKLAEGADKIQKSFGDAFNDLRANVGNAFKEIGIALQDVLLPFITTLNNAFIAVRAFAKAHPDITKIVVALAGLAGSNLLLGVFTSKLGFIGGLIPALTKNVGTLTGVFITLAGFVAGPLVSAFRILQAVILSLLANPLLALFAGIAAVAFLVIQRITTQNEKLEETLRLRKEILAVDKELKESGGEAFEPRGIIGLNEATSKQLEDEQKLIENKLKRAKLIQEEIRVTNGELSGAYGNATIKVGLLEDAQKEYAAQLILTKAAEEAEAKSVKKSTTAFKLTKEAVDSYTQALRGITTEQLVSVTNELNRQEEAGIRAAGTNAERAQQVQDDFAKARIDAAQATANKLIDIDNVSAARQKAIAEKSVPEGVERAAAIRAIDLKLREDQIKNLQLVTKAIEIERGKAIAAYQKYADRVRALELEIAGIKRSFEQEGLDEARQGLAARERIADIELELQRNRDEISKSVGARDFDLARELITRQKELFGQIKATAKESGLEVDLQGLRRDLMEENVAVVQEERNVTGQLRDEQLTLSQTLDARLAIVQSIIANLQGQSLALLDVDNINQAHAAMVLLGEDKAALETPIRFQADVTGVKQVLSELTDTPIKIKIVPEIVIPTLPSAEPTGAGDPSFIQSILDLLRDRPDFEGGTTFGVRGAAGGIVAGGVQGKDSVPVLTMPGEAITRTKAVRYYGEDFFRRLNALQIPRGSLSSMLDRANVFPRFAGGGIVGAAAGGGGLGQRDNVVLNFPFGSFGLSGQRDEVTRLRHAVRVAAVKRR